MADESAEKTEDPTAKRQSNFREEGNIPQSRDIGGVAVLVGGLAIFMWSIPGLYETARELMAWSVGGIARAARDDTKSLIHASIEVMLRSAARLTLPFLSLAFITAILSGLAQTGGNIKKDAIKFDFKAFNLASGLGRLFGSRQALEQLGLSIAKAAVLAAAVYLVLAPQLFRIVEFYQISTFDTLQALFKINMEVVAVALLGASVLAAIDYLLTYRRIHEQMKMSKQEVKDEYKQAEGDPKIKAQMRARMARMGQNRMLSAVADADVVVVNPTHYAVALAYKPSKDRAPMVLAKGKDNLAAKIREVARKNQVPVIANPPVARALYQFGRVGKEIPGDLFEAVARLLAYLYRMRDNRRGA